MPIEANAEIEAMADQLATLRGQSATEVVTTALRAELAREPGSRISARPAKPESSQWAKVKRILDLVRAAGQVGAAEADRTAFLYDAKGLPR